jgi:hypothetical protein
MSIVIARYKLFSVPFFICKLINILICIYPDPDGRIKRRRGPTKLANVSNLPQGVRIIGNLTASMRLSLNLLEFLGRT